MVTCMFRPLADMCRVYLLFFQDMYDALVLALPNDKEAPQVFFTEPHQKNTWFRERPSGPMGDATSTNGISHEMRTYLELLTNTWDIALAFMVETQPRIISQVSMDSYWTMGISVWSIIPLKCLWLIFSSLLQLFNLIHILYMQIGESTPMPL